MFALNTAPGFKAISVDADDRLEILHSAEDVTSGNLSGSVLQFFPSSAPSAAVDGNYVSNPLPGDYPYEVYGLGFDFSLPVIETAANIDVLKIANQLKHAAVWFRADNDRKALVRSHFTEYMQFYNSDYNILADAAGTTFDETMQFKSAGVLRLPNPIHLDANERFDLEVEFEVTDAFPTGAEWDTAGYGTLQLIAFLEVGRPDR